VMNLIEALRSVKASAGATVLLVEQNFRVAAELGDRVAVMDDGRIVHAGAMRELIEDAELQQRLLGLALGAHQ
jgi:branched-chain amino acid transport system ATP-binding protein